MYKQVFYEKTFTQHWIMESKKSFSVSAFKPIINAGAKVRSPQTNYLKHYATFATMTKERKEKRGRGKRKETGNTNMITTVAQAQVITGVKRSPVSPEANEPLAPFHLCGGELSFADCR